MRTCTRILLALLVVAIMGGVTWRALKPRELEYGGRSLNEWLAQAQTVEFQAAYDTNATGPSLEWLEASNAVRHIGTNTIPILLRMLEKQDSALALKLIALAEKQTLIPVQYTYRGHVSPVFHYEPAVLVQGRADIGFQILGADASNAVPDLLQIYKTNSSKDSRLAAAEALGNIGPPAKQAVPFLTELTTNSDLVARYEAHRALGGIHAEPQVVVPLLIASVINTNERIGIRVVAARAIRCFGPEARAAAPDLVAAFHQIESDNKTIRNAETKDRFLNLVKQALQAIDPETAAKLPGDKKEERK